jgi:hypothetical protein
VTRREAIRAATVAATAPLALPARSRALTKDDLKKLEGAAVARAVAAEQTAMVAFEAIANGGLLDAPATATMRVLLDHATQHADLLAQTLKSEVGQDPPLPPTRTTIAGLAGLRRQRDALRLAVRLLDRAMVAHSSAVRQTLDAQLLKAVAGIVGSDAQGLVLLRQLLHTEPVPTAFERGAA